jgi:hypothetical protein
MSNTNSPAAYCALQSATLPCVSLQAALSLLLPLLHLCSTALLVWLNIRRKLFLLRCTYISQKLCRCAQAPVAVAAALMLTH